MLFTVSSRKQLEDYHKVLPKHNFHIRANPNIPSASLKTTNLNLLPSTYLDKSNKVEEDKKSPKKEMVYIYIYIKGEIL